MRGFSFLGIGMEEGMLFLGQRTGETSEDLLLGFAHHDGLDLALDLDAALGVACRSERFQFPLVFVYCGRIIRHPSVDHFLGQCHHLRLVELRLGQLLLRLVSSKFIPSQQQDLKDTCQVVWQ